MQAMRDAERAMQGAAGRAGAPAEVGAYAIEVEDVNKSFGRVQAVRNLNMRIPRGSIYGFLGPNGAGKTTTLRMMMNIILPDSGRIRVLGHADTSISKDRIGYMPEERGLYRKMRVGDQLAFLGGIHGMSGRALRESIARWMSAVGLAGHEKRRVEELSKGNQQKLQFVGTMLHEPELLILDEPFSGLDPVNVDLLRQLMLRCRDEGRTVIFSTHMMEQAEKVCDFLLLINKGEKVADGTLAQLRAADARRIVRLECDGPTDFLDALPMVEHVHRNARSLEISIREGGDAQEVLRAAVAQTWVQAFEVKQPSLEEIFIHLVGACDA